MFSSPHVFKANIDDIPELVKLINSAYRGDSAKQGWTYESDLIEGSLRIDERALIDILYKKDTVILKYCDEAGKILGCVYLQKQERQLYLGMLTVAPNQQNRGIGKELLAASSEYAQQQNCSSIVMTVISLRDELIAWYERHGFQKTGETQPFPADDTFGVPRRPLEFAILKKQITSPDVSATV